MSNENFAHDKIHYDVIMTSQLRFWSIFNDFAFKMALKVIEQVRIQGVSQGIRKTRVNSASFSTKKYTLTIPLQYVNLPLKIFFEFYKGWKSSLKWL